MNKLIIFILAFIFIPSVYSLGVTPGKNTIDYVPGEVSSFTVNVLNDEAQDLDLVILIQGELANYISVSDASFHMSSSDTTKSITYSINVPSDLGPGTHEGDIAIVSLLSKSEASEAFVGVSAGVVTKIQVNSPYPGKYVDASLDAVGPDDSGKITFVIPVLSRGKLDLSKVHADIEIYTSLNEKIDEFLTQDISLLSGERGQIVGEWDSSQYNNGKYTARANLFYDEEVIVLEDEFNIGQRLVELESVEVNDFSLGGIAKFEILVQNKWGEDIQGAYAEMQVHDPDGGLLTQFKSSNEEIPAFGKKVLYVFWDTDGVRKGNYDSTLVLNYGSDSSRKDLELEVSDNNIKVVGLGYVISKSDSNSSSSSLVVVLITVIVLLVLLNLVWFLIIRKKIMKK